MPIAKLIITRWNLKRLVIAGLQAVRIVVISLVLSAAVDIDAVTVHEVAPPELDSPELADSFGLRFLASDLVAQVEIVGVHRDVDKALSEPGMVALLGYVYSASLQQIWKGKNNSQVVFRLGFNACERKLKKSAKYLIFAQMDAQGRLQLQNCDGFVAESEAEPLLVLLKKISQQG